MNAGKILIWTALLVLSFALMVSPSGAVPQKTILPVGGGSAFYAVRACDPIPAGAPTGYPVKNSGPVCDICIPPASCTSAPCIRCTPHIPCLQRIRSNESLYSGAMG